MSDEILSEKEWEHWFAILCRADELDDDYTAEEKLRLHERALRAALRLEVEARNEAWDFGDGWRDKANDLAWSVINLEAVLREAKSGLLRYGRHDSDCPAREYVMVDGIPTTCDCGLQFALDAVLAPATDQPPIPQQTIGEPGGGA